jgi:hypothetical protein
MKLYFTKLTPIVCFACCLVGCSALKDLPKYQLQDDYYLVSQKGQPSIRGFVHLKDDSISVLDTAGNSLPLLKNADVFFLKKSFDVDLLAVPFKYRPPSQGFPQQLNSNINGNVMLGYRIDRFHQDIERSPAGYKKTIKHRGLAIGGFGGFGATFVSPWTTGSQITDEYDGVVITRGITALVAVNTLTVGFGVGWDYLTDRNKNIWIYQNKPWFGLTVGLNLN